MKKLNAVSGYTVSLALSITFLLPSIGLGEYDDYSSRLNELGKDTSKAEDLLGSTDSGTGEESFSEKVQKSLKKAQKFLKTSKEEQDQREKLANWTKKNDGVKSLLAFPDMLMQKALKSRETELSQAEGLLSSLGNRNNTVNPQNFSMNGMQKACRKDVDFTQLMTLTQQLGSQPFQYLQGEASKLLEEKTEELKKKQAAKISDIMKYFKELANKEEGDELSKIDALKGNNKVEARLQRLKEANKNKKEENKELKNSLVEVYGKLINDLGTLQKNDKRVQQLGDEFAKSIENNLQAARMTAQQNVDQLLTNCQNEVKWLRTDIENFKSQLVARGWDPSVAEADAQAQRARAQAMNCTDVTQSVQAFLTGSAGSGLTERLSRIRAEKNPTRMLSEAVSAMQDVANIQQQVGNQLKPLMQDCDQAASGREGVKQRFASLSGGQSGGQAPNGIPAASSQPGQARNSGAPGSQGTHSGNNFGARQGRF